jgi:hypothetical protein
LAVYWLVLQRLPAWKLLVSLSLPDFRPAFLSPT